MSLLEKLHVFQLLRSLLVADGRAFSLFFLFAFFFLSFVTLRHHLIITKTHIQKSSDSLSLSLSFSLSSDEEEEVKKKKKTKKTKNVVVFVCL